MVENNQSAALKAYLKSNKKPPAVKINSTAGRGNKDDPQIIIQALMQNWSTIQQRLQDLPTEDQNHLRDLLNNDVEGVEDFGDMVFDKEKEDFERMQMDWMEHSRESLKELLLAA